MAKGKKRTDWLLIGILGAIALFLFSNISKLAQTNQQVASLNNTLNPISSITNLATSLLSGLFSSKPKITKADPSMFGSINQFTPYTASYTNPELYTTPATPTSDYNLSDTEPWY
jgi:hypothetical protein